MTARTTLRRRLAALETHLTAEIPDLLPVLRACREADRVVRRMGLLPPGESLATRVQWWPVVAVVGADGPAKAAFLDGARSSGGRRPADDGAVLLRYGGAPPGFDPRIPAGLSGAVPVESGDGERLRGRILVDAAHPDEPLLDLADLVLVFPDDGGTEPAGLAPVLAAASRRADARKVLSVHDADPALLDARLEEAARGRARRIAGLLDALAEELEDELVPYLRAALARWRRSVRRGVLVWTALLAAALGGAVVLGGSGNLPAFAAWLVEARPAVLHGAPVRLLALLAGTGGLWLAGCLWVRRAAAQRVAAGLAERMGEADLTPRRAFLKSTGLFRVGVAGWGDHVRRRLAAIRAAAANSG